MRGEVRQRQIDRIADGHRGWRGVGEQLLEPGRETLWIQLADLVHERAGGGDSGVENRCVAWHGRDVFVGNTSRIQRVDFETGEVVGKFRRPDRSPAHDWPVLDLAVSRDGLLLASGSFDGVASLWRRDGTWLRDLVRGSTHVPSVDFTPDDKQVLLGFADGRLASE